MIRFLAFADTLAHVLDRVHLIPRRAKDWLCDRYELALGVTPTELRRTT